jgi:hypothetical protein
MTKSQTSRLAVIAVVAASLLAVGVVTAFSMTKLAEAQISVDISGFRNRATQTNTNTVDQSATATSGLGSASASNTATTTQSNTATQTNSINVAVN